MSTELSILVPSFNEEENINNLLYEIDKNFNTLCEFEVVIVDDGSKNALLDFIKFSDYDFKLKVIRNNYNKGQSASIKIALDNIDSNSNLIGLIDGDGQNPPSELARLYSVYLDSSCDAVVSYRHKRKDNISKKIISKIANFFLKFLTKSNYKDLGSSLKIIKLHCLEQIDFENGDMHRFISPILAIRNFNIIEIAVSHKERKYGKSNYGFSRLVPVLVDGFIFYFTDGFTKPKKYTLGKISAYAFIASSIINIIVLYQKIIMDAPVHRNPLFMISLIMLLISFQTFVSAINE